jgi:hypothetical protein
MFTVVSFLPAARASFISSTISDKTYFSMCVNSSASLMALLASYSGPGSETPLPQAFINNSKFKYYYLVIINNIK